MRLQYDVKNEAPANSMEEAQRLLWRHINIALGGSRACVEYKGWFLISRLDWAKPDDGSFKSGFAVKKGTTEIH
ncbi:MAG: hypothetical protein JXB10_10675 [Pirellulales bacterium]|nr:hypothetical protein [Pirellulales bacterium]